MKQSLSDSLQQKRLMVVEADQATGRLRVKADGNTCSDLTCHDDTVVVGDDGVVADLGSLNPGDIIKLDSVAGRPERIVVVRRVWEELTSPEF